MRPRHPTLAPETPTDKSGRTQVASLILCYASGGQAAVHVGDTWLRRALTATGIFRGDWRTSTDYWRFEEAFLAICASRRCKSVRARLVRLGSRIGTVTGLGRMTGIPRRDLFVTNTMTHKRLQCGIVVGATVLAVTASTQLRRTMRT